MFIIIGVVGRICSGKTEFSKLLSEDFEFQNINNQFYNLDQIFQQIKQERQKNPFTNQDQIQELVKKELCLQNQQIQLQSQQNCQQIQKLNSNNIINNFTLLEEIQLLQRRNSFHLVSVDAPINKRYQQFKNQYKEISSFIDFETFALVDDLIYYEFNYQKIMNQSKFNINNTQTLKHFKQNIIENQKMIIRDFRPNFDIYFMKLAYETKKRSNCFKRSVGAIITLNNRILSTGYNGTSQHHLNCYEGGCKRCVENTQQGKDLIECVCIHAEENCILEIGIKHTKGACIYTTLFPCNWCAKIILQSGINRVVYSEEYNENKSKVLFEGKLEIVKLNLSEYIY
ncbi:hypothetical protein IMG5_155880 [Ichthyophthirius multifiliis]|uniref:dCMP deaminase n=1 Tax=Ichthyophthirius multifiliis TaxID=5932 RepID=G0QZD5_ICHMU|nr:hypothetical protein IMG5_155880 [Ichthyophthirius multifiliis]EGR29438.1 hypothetical protein IMG5_155880 [Ichthyophthirius multifiliis]|eukprot:XP_004030674.1 hypothetical protein IMG5_155880 [Ichthyophthirius multifiliis]